MRKIKIKAFITLEIFIVIFMFTTLLKLSYIIIQQYNYHYNISCNKNKMLILKKYLCHYIKENFKLPEISNNQLNITNNNMFNQDKIFLIPNNFTFNNKNKPFKLYMGDISKNEILHITDEDYTINIIIYGHDIDIFDIKKLQELHNNCINKKKLLFYNTKL